MRPPATSARISDVRVAEPTAGPLLLPGRPGLQTNVPETPGVSQVQRVSAEGAELVARKVSAFWPREEPPFLGILPNGALWIIRSGAVAGRLNSPQKRTRCQADRGSVSSSDAGEEKRGAPPVLKVLLSKT